VRALVFAALCWSTVAAAGTYDIHPSDDLYGRLQMLQAGDEVIVHAGTYMTPGFLQVTWAGTASQPIVIHAAPGDRPVLQGTFAQNTINIGGSYWTLQGFEITGGSHGLRLQAVDHATIQDNVIHGTGDVGISCNFEPNSCDSVHIVHNEIYDTGKDSANGATGEGMYLGCNNAACTFTNSVVELNYVHDMGGNQGDGIEIKEGAHDNIVRDNVIVRSNYPGITMYGFAGSGGPNIVERNVVWHVKSDNGIQVVGQIIVRNNLVLDTAITGIASKPSQNATPHDVAIINNTVAGAGVGCLKTGNWATEHGQVIANNAFYCDGASAVDITGGAGADLVMVGNVGLGTSNATGGFAMGTTTANDVGDPATGNVYPPPGSALFGKADPSQLPADDFNGLTRTLQTAGAYDGATTANPGWIVTEGFKTPPPQTVDAPFGGEALDPNNPGGTKSGGCCDSGGGGGESSLLLVLASVFTWSSGRWMRRFRRRRRSNPR
jgi:hypothetical protein